MKDLRGVPGEEEKLLAELKTRAAVDPDFRKRLLDAPREAIAEIAGGAPPSDLRIRFIEKPADVDVLLILPDQPRREEMTPEELERVAGGCIFSCGIDSCGAYSCEQSTCDGWTCVFTCITASEGDS